MANPQPQDCDILTVVRDNWSQLAALGRDASEALDIISYAWMSRRARSAAYRKLARDSLPCDPLSCGACSR